MKKVFITVYLLLISCVYAGQQAKNTSIPLDSIAEELSQNQLDYLDNLPGHVIYDWLEVPEDHSKPEGQKIRVFYECHKSNKSTTSIPVVFFYGGPGFNPDHSVKETLPWSSDLEYLVIHQRGTGLSSPLPPCERPSDIIRYRHYLSRAIVEDSEYVRKKRYQDKPWIVCGQSFGSLITQRYITMHPKSIHSAHAHGYAASAQPNTFAEERIRKHHEVLTKYLKDFPEDEERLRKIAQYCEENSFSPPADQAISIHGRHVFSFVALIMLSSPDYWAYFSNILTEVCPQDKVIPRKLKSTLMQFYFNKHYLYLGREQDVLNIAFNRLEAYVPERNQSLSHYYEEIIKKLKKENIDTSQWLVGEEALMHFCIKSRPRQIADSIDFGEPDTLHIADIINSLKANNNIKFYLYSGKIDNVAPPKMFEDIVKGAGSLIEYKELPGGHGSFLHSEFWDRIKEEAQVNSKLKEAA